MVLAAMMVFAISIVTVVAYSSSAERDAKRSTAKDEAYHLAEAGLAEAISIVGNASDPTVTNLLPSTVRNFNGGTATYSGTYDGSTATWSITSTGQVNNPSNPGTVGVKRTLTQTATVQPLVAGATAPEWDRFFNADASSCMNIDTVTITANVTSAGGLCLQNTGTIAGTSSVVEVGGNVTQTASSSGSPTQNAGTASGWTNSTRVTTSDDSDATNVIAGSGNGANLNSTSFGFSVPSNATITGITATVERAASALSSVRDLNVFLLKAGSPVGTDHAFTATNWGTTDATVTYGTSTDLWGTTWTPTDINASNFGLRFRARNVNGSSRTANVDYVEIQVYYEVVSSTIGTAGSPIARAEVGGTCQSGSKTAHTPCSGADRVYAGTYTTTPPNLTKPAIDFAYWYQNAKPGPKHNCTSGSFPGGFDNDSTYNNSLPDVGNGNEDLDITPTNTNYDCQYWENGQMVGRIAWNHTTHVMNIKGTIFVDGPVRFDKDGQLVNYNGRAILYSAGNIEFDEVVCAGGTGTFNCYNNMSNWDPETNMMIIVSGGWSEYDQGDDCCPLRDAGFQGVMYAKDQCVIHQLFHSSGPVICNQIQIVDDTGTWPTFYPWPPLQTLIAGQMYGSFASAADYDLTLGKELG